MRVVLSGYYGFHNVGDEAILLSIITALREIKKDIQITVLSNDTKYTEKTYDVDAVNRWKMKDVYAAMKNADGFISGGGSLLQDKTGFKSIPYYLGVMKIAQFARIPFFIYAQGMGPISKNYNRKLVKMVLSKAAYLSVRDKESKELLEGIGVKNEIQLVPDPVLGFHYLSAGSNWLIEQGLAPELTIAVSIRDWMMKNEYKKKLAKALDELIEEGYNIVFVPMHGEHDGKASAEVVSLMNETATIFPYDATIEQKIDVIGKSALLIGMRLHALIFSAITNTPMIGLSYDPKIDSFMKQANQPMIGHVEGDWTSSQLVSLVAQQLDQLDTEKEKLHQAISPLQQKARETAKAVVDYLS